MKILVADDDPITRRQVQHFLTSWGYEVVVASDGESAWQLLSAPDSPTLSILDWMMPGLTGVEICRRLRQFRDRPYVYVILLTGKTGKHDMVAGLRAGADDYLCKPFLPVELQCRLHTGSRILRLQKRLIAARDNLMDRATHDDLTGLWNRAAICERLQWALDGSESQPVNVGIALADVDNFKHINDTRGHLIGDEMLAEVAGRMRIGLGTGDCVGRYGGDEFLIVFSGSCTCGSVIEGSEGIRQRVASTPIEAPGGTVSTSVSIGVTWKPADSRCSCERLLQTADVALYRAKANGRNQVVFLPSGAGERGPLSGPLSHVTTHDASSCLVGDLSANR